MKSCAEFYFIDAPHPATAEFLGDVPEDRGAALGWFNVGETTPGARPAISAQYVGVDEALKRIAQTIEQEGPFDGVLGFSQGATIAAYCCLHPELCTTPFRFAIIFSAFAPRDPSFDLGGCAAQSLPTFHCFGLNDPSVPPESSRRVAAHFDQASKAAIRHEHDGGHGVPSDANLRAALKAFISECMDGASPPLSAAAVPSQQQAAPKATGGGKGGKGGGSCKGGGGNSDASSERCARDYTTWRQLKGLGD